MVSLFLEAFPTTQINLQNSVFKKSRQSPTGHPNQIYKANERQPLPVISQSLQIFHKFYCNLSGEVTKSQQAPIEDNWHLILLKKLLINTLVDFLFSFPFY